MLPISWWKWSENNPHDFERNCYDLKMLFLFKGCDVNFLKYFYWLVTFEKNTYIPNNLFHFSSHYCITIPNFSVFSIETQIDFLKFNQQWNNLPLSSTSS